MRWLLTMVRAIGRVVGITHPVGHVVPVQGFQIGGEFSIADSKLQPANPELKPKRSRAKQDTQAQSPKVEISRAPTRTKKLSTNGTQPATPARQPAQSKRKPAAKAAPSTTQAKSRKPAQKTAPATRGATGSQSKPTARKTRQHAK